MEVQSFKSVVFDVKSFQVLAVFVSLFSVLFL